MARAKKWGVYQTQAQYGGAPVPGAATNRQVLLEGGFFRKDAAEEALAGWKRDGAADLSVREQK